MKEVRPELVSSRIIVWDNEFANPIDGPESLVLLKDSTDKDDGARPFDKERLCYVLT